MLLYFFASEFFFFLYWRRPLESQVMWQIFWTILFASKGLIISIYVIVF